MAMLNSQRVCFLMGITWNNPETMAFLMRKTHQKKEMEPKDPAQHQKNVWENCGYHGMPMFGGKTQAHEKFIGLKKIV